MTPIAATERVINAASVPHRSPFRYPGGKTWLVPYIRQWLATRPQKPASFIEPFAGGAIVGLSVAFEGLTDAVTLIEKDVEVASVWQTILNGKGEELAQRIRTFHLTRTSAEAVLSTRPKTRIDRAFSTIIRNRVQRGGILAAGASLMKNGENGRGVASRWYPETLAKRIEDIISIKKRLTFIHGDGLASMVLYGNISNTVFFIDPPYTVAGRRLYTFSEVNHEEIFRNASALDGDFLMTYDASDMIKLLAGRYGFQTVAVAMKNTHHEIKRELLIGRDLSWLTAS